MGSGKKKKILKVKISIVVNDNFLNVDHEDTFFANYSKFQVYKTVYTVKAISPFTPIILRRLLTLEPRLQQRGVGARSDRAGGLERVPLRRFSRKQRCAHAQW